MNKRKIISMLLAGTFGMSTMLTGCGGGGNSSPTSTPQNPAENLEAVSGVVADGYLNGAKVCLDVNLNKACEENEPSVFSGAGGKYTISIEELAKLPEGKTADEFPILVEVKPEYKVIDEVDGNGTPVTKEYILSAPKGKPEFVSPITTLIQEEMESSVEEITPEQAEKTVKARIGVADDVDLFDDYIAPNTDHLPDEADKEALKEKMRTVHMVAQVVANTMGDMKAQLDQIEELKDVSLDVIIKAVVNEVMSRLETIVTQVEAAKEELGEEETFDPTAVVAKVEETEGAFDAEKAQEAVAVAEIEKATAKSSFKTVLEGGGSSWVELHFDYDEETQKEIPELEIGTVKLDESGNLSEQEMVYDFANGAWGELLDEEEDRSFILTADGWALIDEGPEGYDMGFDENGSVLLTRKADGMKEILTVAEANLSGKYQGHFAGRLGRFLVDPEKTFRDGAKAHKLSFTRTADTYEIWDDDWNRVRVWEGQNETEVKTLDQMVEDYFVYNPDQVDGHGLGVGRDLSARFEKIDEKSGILHLYIWEPCAHQPKKLAEKGAWKRFAPLEGGPEILLVDIPGAYAFKYGDREERTFFAVRDGVVKYGHFIPAGVQNGMEELMYNTVALDDLKGNLNYDAIENASPMDKDQEPSCNDPYPGDPNMGGGGYPEDPNKGEEPHPEDPNMGGEPALEPEPSPETIGSFDAQADLMGRTFAFVDSNEVCVMTFNADYSLSEACREEFNGMTETMTGGGTWQLDEAGVLHGQFEGDSGITKVYKLNDSTSSTLSIYLEDWEGEVLKYNAYEKLYGTTAFNDPKGLTLVGVDGVSLAFDPVERSGQFTDPSGQGGFFDYTLEADGSMRMYMQNGDEITMFLMAEGATTTDYPVVGYMKDMSGKLVDVIQDNMTVSSM